MASSNGRTGRCTKATSEKTAGMARGSSSPEREVSRVNGEMTKYRATVTSSSATRA